MALSRKTWIGSPMTRVLSLCIPVLFTAACSSESSTTAPTPPPAATRIIRVGGNLNFGDVAIGTVRNDGVLTVSNDGDAILEVTGMTGPCGQQGDLRPTSPTRFNVAPGETLNVGFMFAPTVPVNCSGTIRVDGNQTSGTNTIAVTARGVVPPGCGLLPTGGIACAR